MEDAAQPWLLETGLDFLNHGSFGACPREVLEAQAAWRERMERDPVRFLAADLEPALDDSRARLGAFLGARPEDLAFVPNATAGVNTVLRSLAEVLRPGDEILTTDHEYNAVLNAIRRVSERTGARMTIARMPFPLASVDEAVAKIVGAVTHRTRLAVISHVTSATALVLPIAEIVRRLAEAGVDTLVDGAHGPGMLPFDLDAIGAAYYAGNGHKWLCAPKGSGFLHVRRDRQDRIEPLVISHGANSPRVDRSRFLLEFDWTGTADPTAWLSLGTAIDVVGRLADGGWPALMAANRSLALEGAAIVRVALGVEPAAPEAMIGSMVAIPVPADLRPRAEGGAAVVD